MKTKTLTKPQRDAAEMAVASFMIYAAVVRSPDIDALSNEFRNKVIGLTCLITQNIIPPQEKKFVTKSIYKQVFKSLLKT
jgi:hypothetical protein